MTDERITLLQEGGSGDELEAYVSGSDIVIQCDEPWAGDTEFGFGHKAAVPLTKEQAMELAKWIMEKCA